MASNERHIMPKHLRREHVAHPIVHPLHPRLRPEGISDRADEGEPWTQVGRIGGSVRVRAMTVRVVLGPVVDDGRAEDEQQQEDGGSKESSRFRRDGQGRHWVGSSITGVTLSCIRLAFSSHGLDAPRGVVFDDGSRSAEAKSPDLTTFRSTSAYTISLALNRPAHR
jgi:hypothetical protein